MNSETSLGPTSPAPSKMSATSSKRERGDEVSEPHAAKKIVTDNLKENVEGEASELGTVNEEEKEEELPLERKEKRMRLILHY